MSETQSCCNMDMCKTARLWQENSALRARADHLESVLSLYHGAAMFYYGIATGLRVTSPEAVLAAIEAQSEQNKSSAEESSGGSMCEQLPLFREKSRSGYPPNCS